MQTETHPLESFFHHEVRNIFENRLGLNDPEMTTYVARLLCTFSESDTVFHGRDVVGYPIDELKAMMKDADPVYGTATSFDAERSMRKYIGDYALFVAGMLPEAIDSEALETTRRPSLGELIAAGKQSYYIVSQFNVFEYKKEAALFGRLSEQFERYILGLALVREELGKRVTEAPVN
jgi:hypothetical protein